MDHHEKAGVSPGEASSISDPFERRRLALAKIDNAPFGWHHIRAVIVAGVGFFTDSYDIFAINLTVSMIGAVYWQGARTSPASSLLPRIPPSRLQPLAALSSVSFSSVGLRTVLVVSACTESS